MKQRKCPSGRHNSITACWDYGSCEECAFGKMIQRYENRIARLKKAAAKQKPAAVMIYGSTTAGKAAFVAEVLSPLLVQADTGWNGAEYVKTDRGEYVFLLTPQGWRSKQIDITADSLEAIVREVFQSL